MLAGQTGLMAEQAPQGDRSIRLGLVAVKAGAYVELTQGLLDRRIQRQVLLLHQLQRRRGGQQLGDATCAKRGIGRDRHPQVFVSQAKAAGPDQLLAIDQGNRQSRHIVPRHLPGNAGLQVADDCAVIAFLNRRRGRRLRVATDTAQQATQ